MFTEWGEGACADFQLGLVYQPLASEILTESSHYKTAEGKLLKDEKVYTNWARLSSVLYIYTYTYITSTIRKIRNLTFEFV